MSKLLIYVAGRPATNGYHIREFKWSEPHKKFIYLGREIEDYEFNALFEKAWKNNADLTPKALSLATGPAPAAVVAPPPPAPISDEEAADKAEELLQRLRPDRLKLKPGRKPAPLDLG